MQVCQKFPREHKKMFPPSQKATSSPTILITFESSTLSKSQLFNKTNQ
uniref:Uncharacterized protein n=1 Tax=Rhizophora mucronata TaxID=61149 RepID=A0A2P2J2Y5_RHIMU